MKKLKILSITAFAAITLFAGNVYSQNAAKVVVLEPVIISGTSPVKLDQKLNMSFSQSFPGAVNATWYKVEKNYLVKFIMHDENNRVLYNPKGQMIYAISYGFEKDLSFNVKKSISSSYFGYNISSAINVNQDNRTIWFVTVENDKSFVLLQIEDEAIIKEEPTIKTV